MIDSGGSSIHAWVKVDAKTPEQYQRRREKIWDSLKDFPIDPQNRNPSHYSRCPGGLRGDCTQRLLAVNLGHSSYKDWEQKHDTLGLSAPLRISQLADYDTSNDPNNVLGNRWLCKGASLIIVGQSGIGKSSFSIQLAVLWGLGLVAFNIKPVRPLRSLIIQAENDIGDLAEMFQGVRHGAGITPAQQAVLDENVIIYRDTVHSSHAFAKCAQVLIERHKPDLVWGDLLLNYIGDDASQQKVISEFCCRLLNPISERTGIIWCLMHHTGKPPTDPKAKSHWTTTDLAYSGLGSSALTNWAREVAVLSHMKVPPDQPPTFLFALTKRPTRARLTDLKGNPDSEIYLRHSHADIYWQQCDKPPEPTSNNTYRIGKKARPSEFNPQEFRTTLESFGGAVTRKNAAAIALTLGKSESTVWRWWKKLNNND